MTIEQFNVWLDGLKRAWEAKSPQAAADLCAEKVEWHEIPFGKPFITKHEVFNEWESLPESQKDISVIYEILDVTDNFGIAHWSAKFTRLPSEEKAHLDGIYKVSLNKEGLCTEFHQWYNSE